jgi:O-acetyl-ADP-ribose deacetylase (regulator of RNase III)
MGNLIQAPEIFIAHGCNAQGVMGSGVAKAIRTAWPIAYSTYLEYYKTHGLRVGDVIWADVDCKYIANCITQKKYGYDGSKFVDYDAIRVCMKKVNLELTTDLALPRIGAGLGGGDWNIISSIIEDEITNAIPVVYDL